jgi:hypothetical protein
MPQVPHSPPLKWQSAMVFRSVVAILLIAFLSHHVDASSQRSPESIMPGTNSQNSQEMTSADELKYWRVRNRCGVNSTYVILRLLGKTVEYDDVMSALPIGSSGTSMADMRRYLNEKEVPAAVIRATPETLADVRFPVIAMMEEDASKGGHFVVLFGMTDTAFHVIDGTGGAVDVVAYEQFVRRWNGFLIAVDAPRSGFSWLWISMMLMGVATIAHGVYRRRERVHGRTQSPG